MTNKALTRAKRIAARAAGTELPAALRARLADLQRQARGVPDPDAPCVLRSIHHMACTGGTLIARAIAASPGVRLLSEVDPFSSMTLTLDTYTPTDLIRFARQSPRGVDTASVTAMFQAALAPLVADLDRRGAALVLRDHSHSHFGYDEARPLMRDVLADAFAPQRIVTVRHPLDSWLALVANGWVRFTPATLEEYARRYTAFLDAYAGDPIFAYEDFLADPDATLQGMLAALTLDFTPDWRDHMHLHRLSGDSGRKSTDIGLRPRRPVPASVAAAARTAAGYRALCARLGYDPDPQGPQMPVRG